MKRVGIFTLCFTYVGCFFGAGFVSGRELWQFFGAFGVWGYAGFVVAALLFVAFGMVLIRLTQMTGETALGRLMVPWENLKWLRSAAGILTSLFLFGVVMVMSAGVGALLRQLFGIPAWVASAVFTLVVVVIAYFGITGMLRAFSLLMPVLVVAAVLFAVGAWSKFDTSYIWQIQNVNINPLMPNWFIASLTFVAYNLLGGIGIMVQVGPLVEKKSTVRIGISLSGVAMVIVAACILTSVAVYPLAADADMPMVAVATALRPTLGYFYGILLLLGMFSNALASLVSLMSLTAQRLPCLREKRREFLAVMAIVVFAGSLFGFSNIIGVAFPIFGYLSIPLLVAMVTHYIQCKRCSALAAAQGGRTP